MNAADTSASSAIADWTPLTVVPRSRTTAEIETFISEVSTTSTNIAGGQQQGQQPLVALYLFGAAAGTCTLGHRRPAISPVVTLLWT